MPDPTPGRMVRYRSKVNPYDLPATIVATVDSLWQPGVDRWRETGGLEGVPPLSSPDHVHLVVMTPGLPTNPEIERQQGWSPQGGTYQEWDVPLFEPHTPMDPRPGVVADAPVPAPGSWRWPERS